MAAFHRSHLFLGFGWTTDVTAIVIKLPANRCSSDRCARNMALANCRLQIAGRICVTDEVKLLKFPD